MENKIAGMIDHTLLKATATEGEITNLCNEAKKYGFKTVCVPSYYVEQCKKELSGTEIGITTVVGFPLGNSTTKTKIFEALEAIDNGATDIDTVINVGALKDKKYDYVLKDIKDLVEEIKKKDNKVLVKVILEDCYLTKEEIRKATELVVESGADFVKTSTGFGTGGATLEDVKIMKEVVGDKIQIKAAGGIRDSKVAQDMIDLGVTRLGVSQSIAIVTGGQSTGLY